MRPSLETVCAQIQRAAIDPDAWQAVQSVTEAFMGARGAHLASVDVRLKHMVWNRTTRYEEHDAYIAEISGDSEPVRYTLKHPHWRSLMDSDVVTPAEMKHSFYYTECAKMGIGYRLGLRLLDTPDRLRALVFLWRPEDGHVGARELERLALIENQLRLAAFVSDQFPAGLREAQQMVSGLDIAGCAALVLEADGRIVTANAAAERILAARDGLGVTQGVLTPTGQSASTQLTKAIDRTARAAAAPGETQVAETVATPRPSGLPAYFLTLAPLACTEGFLGPTRNLILAILRDPAAGASPAAALLRTAFGLTSAEAAVCKRFSEGATARQIALERGVAEGSLRQQLKNVMTKTGVRRQSELMRLLAALPEE